MPDIDNPEARSMLVLSRKPGERLVIDGNILVEVISTSRGRVRLGIRAPRHVHIRRNEVPEWVKPKAPSRESAAASEELH